MKNFVFLLSLFCLSATYCQNKLVLSVEKKSDRPLSQATHFYQYKIENSSLSNIDYQIITETIPCNNNSELSISIFNNLQEKTVFGKINPNTNSNFTLQLSRKASTQLDSWFCVSIKAVSKKTGETISNVLEMNHFTPNPQNFN